MLWQKVVDIVKPCTKVAEDAFIFVIENKMTNIVMVMRLVSVGAIFISFTPVRVRGKIRLGIVTALRDKGISFIFLDEPLCLIHIIMVRTLTQSTICFRVYPEIIAQGREE